MRKLGFGVWLVVAFVGLGCTSTADEGTCGVSLPVADLDRVVFDAPIGETVGVQSGSTYAASLGLALTDRPCCEVERADICATFGMDREIPGVDVNPIDGTVTATVDVPHGTAFLLVADIEGGRRTVSLPVEIYSPQVEAMAGTWSEVAQMECGSGSEVAPATAMRELVFHDSGEFDATWSPNEAHRDYWGRFEVRDDGGLDLFVEGGNYIPSNLDGSGRVAFAADGSMVLSEMWLGRYGEEATYNCGHRFR